MPNIYAATVDGILEQLLRHLSATGQVSAISKQFSALKTNAERVDFVYQLLDGRNLLPAFEIDSKNNELSANLREKGNGMFKIRKNGEAIEFYTKSVALAEDGSEQLGLAYANRSAVLFETGFYKECLTDIDRALGSAYPENLKPKLLIRQGKAKELGSKQSPIYYFEPIPELPKQHRNKRIQSAADSIEIRNTKDQGRHVVATRDISVGEILAVEEPYCHVLIDNYHNHCHHCLKLCYNLLPCRKCTQAMYCSEECNGNASAYHRYECKVLATIRKLEINKLQLLPLKIALLVKDQYSDIENVTNEEEEEYYRSDTYKDVHNLVANTSSRSVSDMFGRASASAVIFHLIKVFADFFQSEEEEDVFKDLVLLHMQTGPCNFHEITELTENNQGVYVPDEIGAGSYSLLSMFNHRCSPNILRNCYGSVIAVRAIESIKKGEQCYDNYGYHHAVMCKSERKTKLMGQYFFDCVCEMCVRDWPLYLDLPEIKTDVTVDQDDIIKLQTGDVEVAKQVLRKVLPKFKELEIQKPNRNLAEVQETVKQCFALLGNIRKTL